MDLAHDMKNLLTAYEALPPTPRRIRIVQSLRETYLQATSDSLESFFDAKTINDRVEENEGLVGL